jgi:acyl carrier protein
VKTIERIQNILRVIFDDDSISIHNQMYITDVKGWDSLANIQIILSIEEEFNIQFSLEEMGSFKKIDDIVKILDNFREKGD